MADAPGGAWPEAGEDKARSEQANGAISITEDVLLVLAQSGHSCVVPP